MAGVVLGILLGAGLVGRQLPNLLGIARRSAQATALLVRVGGLLLATIGAQMLLGGLKNSFAA